MDDKLHTDRMHPLTNVKIDTIGQAIVVPNVNHEERRRERARRKGKGIPGVRKNNRRNP